MRAGLRALVLLLPALSACSESTIQPLESTAPARGLCVYPRACYAEPARCDCNGGPAACRLGVDGGTMEPPKPTDPGVACPSLCAVPEAICVARGPRCDGTCVHKGDTCDSGTRIAPQRALTDGGTGAFCPFTDDTCCPAPAHEDMIGGDAAGPTDAAPGAG